MHWTAAEVASAVGGSLHGPDVTVEGAAIDSRVVRSGQLFVAVVAERDGHDFIEVALAAGANAYLASRPPEGATAIEVKNTSRALLDLGRAARRSMRCPVVGVTGSVGKTSTKDMITAAAKSITPWANERSFNNELGVPLTLFNAPTDVGLVVVEMGARGPGHIRLLCDVAAPTIAVVTAVAAAHTETFGSVDGVARAKSELVEALPSDGVAVLNADDERVLAMARSTTAPVVSYSSAGRPGAGLVAEDIAFDDAMRPTFVIRSDFGEQTVSLGVSGAHQVGNALAAAAVALHAGVVPEQMAADLSDARLSPWRMEMGVTRGGARIVNDAYNANPASVSSALRTLASMKAERRVAVLGQMAELGEGSDAAHEEVARLASELGIRVIAVGTPAYGVREVVPFDEVVNALGELGPGDAVLLKGSRVAGLERLAQQLLR